MMLEMSHPIGTKASVPRIPERYVCRDRLLDALHVGRRRRVTLISAPAGSGKTTLASAVYRATRHRPRAWLTLDARDNGRARLAPVIVDAMTRGDLTGPIRGGSTSETALLDRAFEGMNRPGFLVIDDVQELTASRALRTLDHLVTRAPAQLDIILVGRADPPVSLARLRGRDELTGLRAADLAFVFAEARALFDMYGVVLPDEDVAALCRRTEGWVAGMRLAAVALECEADPRAFVRDAARTQATVSDYLLREVLERQSPAVQAFLRRTSVSDRLSVDLARELSGEPDAGDRLAQLERGGVFLTGVDDGGTWYRYQGLMATLLRARLREEDPQAATALERTAAHWFDAHGFAVEAELHARRAHDGALMNRLALRRWVDAVLTLGAVDDDDTFELSPADDHCGDYALLAAARAVARGDAREAARHLAGAGDGGGDVAVAHALVRVEYARAFGADTMPAAIPMLIALADHSSANAEHLRVVAGLREVELLLDRNDLPAAMQAASQVRAEAVRVDLRWVWAEATAILALCEAANGFAHSAQALLATLTVDGDTSARRRPTAALAAALAHLLRDEPACARDVLGFDANQGFVAQAARPVGAASQVVGALVSNMPLLPYGIGAEGLHPFALRVVVAVGAFDVLGAQAEAQLPPAARTLSGARRALIRDPGTARVIVLPVVTDTTVHFSTLVEANVVASIASAAIGDDAEGLEFLATACELAGPEGLRTPFARHAAKLRELLERFAPRLSAEQEFALHMLDRLRRGDLPVFVEPLTGREQAVLRYLPTLMSNAEIASELFVSINTVKTHLKAVYRKLGVERRRDAVVRARQLELV